jgi:hypothetical protein
VAIGRHHKTMNRLEKLLPHCVVEQGQKLVLAQSGPGGPQPGYRRIVEVEKAILTNRFNGAELRPTLDCRWNDHMVRTARNRALPSTTRWYAFGASASGYVSTIVLTFPCATKSRAS